MASILVRCVFCDGDAECIIWWTAEMSSPVFAKIASAGFCWCDAECIIWWTAEMK